MDAQNNTEESVTRNDIVSAVSHQLRDPIAYARFAFQALLNDTEHPLSEEQVTLVKKANSRLFDVFELTEKLLLADKVSYTDIPLNLEKIVVGDFVSEVLAEAEPLAASKKVSLQKTPSPIAVIMVGDKILLREALKNIVHNAIKYTPAEGVVTLTYQENNSSIIFDVSDTGAGIASDKVSMLFSKFNRLGNTSHTSGFGLGLYLAKKFIEMHGGTISYSLNQPQGSIFTIEIPHHDIVV